MKLALHLPVNTVSFGQVSTVLLRTLFEREQAGSLEHELYYFPVGNIDLSSQNIPQEFGVWLQGKLAKALESYNRDIPVFKLWHFNGSFESYGKQQTLLTFYELDNPTKIELNIARNHRLCLSSQYAIAVFQMYGIEAKYLPLCFDSYNFKDTGKNYHADGRIVFNLCGKLERRKHHAKIIQTWIKKYGNNPKYALQCAHIMYFLGKTRKNAIEITMNLLDKF